MKLFKLLTLILIAQLTFSNELILKANSKALLKINTKNFSDKLGLKKHNKVIYNPWRKKSYHYSGYNFYEILDVVYGPKWREFRTISFKAADGYQQLASIKKMINNRKTGFLAIGEVNNNGFTKFTRKKKTIDPGPLYLLWEGFNKDSKVSHGDDLKWPYQLVEINLKN